MSFTPEQLQTREGIRKAFRPITYVIGVLLLLAIAAGGVLAFYLMRLAFGIWR